MSHSPRTWHGMAGVGAGVGGQGRGARGARGRGTGDGGHHDLFVQYLLSNRDCDSVHDYNCTLPSGGRVVVYIIIIIILLEIFDCTPETFRNNGVSTLSTACMYHSPRTWHGKGGAYS